MKNLAFSNLFSSARVLSLPLAALLLTGCATHHGNQHHHATKPMAMCSADKDNMGKGGCSCCGMSGEGMSHSMKDKPIGTGAMEGASTSAQGAMCMPGKSGSEKGGCASCGMEKMGAGGCACCGMGKQEMSPEMKQKHMEMMRKHHPEMNHGGMYSQPPAK